MKVKWAYLKKPSVIIGAVILFFILLFMLNKGSGSGSSSGQTVVNQGPSDAQVASSTQLALAQISAGLQGQAIQVDYAKSQDNNATALAVAQMQAVLQGQSLVVQRDIASQTVAAQTHGLDLQYMGLVNQNQTAINLAHEQYSYGLASQAINANTTIQLSQDQLAAYQKMMDVNLVTSLVGHNKYSAIALPAYFGGQSNSTSTASYSQVGTMA
jgi:phage gp37-like protein